MGVRLRARWRAMIGGLWFVPSLIVVLTAILAVVLVRLDRHLALTNSEWVFGGNASAARTVFQTLATALISVAGLTFSVTMVVLQLASSQFTPRVLPNFLGDRITQATVGAFVGVFVFCLIGLRSVGAKQFVPRMTVTVGSGLGVIAVVLLIVFIHHISSMIQASNIISRIGHDTLARLDHLHPEPFGGGVEEDAQALLAEWRHAEPGRVMPTRPGYIAEVDVEELVQALGQPARVHVPAAPGDFVTAGQAVAEVWPREALGDNGRKVTRTISVVAERTLVQDARFGVRQLTDIALRAISPSVNDPTTAVTCIGYIRSVLERLAGREFPSPVRRLDDGSTVVARRPAFAEYLEVLAELGRYAAGDVRVVEALLEACRGIAAAALESCADDRAAAALDTAETIASQARHDTGADRDRIAVDRLLDGVRSAIRS
jgi:uncharacterized membrane protein